MKRPYYLIFSISALLVAGLFLLRSSGIILEENSNMTIILMILGLLAIVVAVIRFKSFKNREPAEDEYTKKVMQKTASYSFYISLYLWVVISYFSEDSSMDTQQVIGLGVVSMAIVFAISWVFVKFIGLRNE
jgi:peptidoglycan/LPS O-acetylase OafA/YrhL